MNRPLRRKPELIVSHGTGFVREASVPYGTSCEEVARHTLDFRCPKECGCSANGKLLARLIHVPALIVGSGAVLEVVCPSRKSRHVHFVL